MHKSHLTLLHTPVLHRTVTWIRLREISNCSRKASFATQNEIGTSGGKIVLALRCSEVPQTLWLVASVPMPVSSSLPPYCRQFHRRVHRCSRATSKLVARLHRISKCSITRPNDASLERGNCSFSRAEFAPRYSRRSKRAQS